MTSWTEMMLGPAGLIPGDPNALHELAQQLAKNSGLFDEVGTRLGGVRVDGWSGKAAEAFEDKLAQEKPKWYRGSDGLATAASAITTYAYALSTAQQAAADALAASPVPMTLTDEGQASVDQAKRNLSDAADALAARLKQLGGEGDDAPKWLQQAGTVAEAATEDPSSIKGSRDLKSFYESDPLSEQHKRTFGTGAEEPADPSKKTPGWEAKLWEKKIEGNVWSAEASGKTELAGIGLEGSADVKLLGAEVGANASLTNDGLKVGASASSYLASASAKGSAEYGWVGASAEGTAFAGAEASTSATIGKDGAHGKAEAFAGAKATGSASADIGGIGAGVSGEAWAGVGAEAGVDAGMKDGKIVIGGSVGVGLGLGGKVSTQMEIDPGKVVDTAQDAAHTVGHAASEVGGGISNAASAVKDFF
jgi:uncharacterized protein YukE